MAERGRPLRLRDKTRGQIQPTDKDLAYAAGFFDGEGSVQIAAGSKKHRSQPRVIVSIAQVDPRPLLWLNDRFGGPVRRKSGRPSKNSRYAFLWYLCGTNTVEFLNLLRPHLIVKAEQADIAVAFHRTVQRQGGFPRRPITEAVSQERENYRQQMKVLNLRGAERIEHDKEHLA